MPVNPEHSPRILIVEDELLVATDLQASLEDLGYEVVGIAETGRSALQLAEKFQPDLVLMDIQLRGTMDGTMAADTIRRRWQLPVVFLTAGSNERMRAKTQGAAAYGYLLKPFRIQELNATMMLAIAQHRSARELFTKDTWLRTVLDSLSDGIIATDLGARVRYMNPSAVRLTGWDSEEAVGKEIGQICILRTFAGQPVERCHLHKTLEAAVPLGSARLLLTRRSGQIVVIEDAASPIVVAEQLVGAVAILRDISELVRKERLEEEEYDRLEDEMAKTNEELGQTRAELRALSSHLIKAEEAERQRLARELHDDFGQRAAILGMRAARALEQFRSNPEESENLLHDISEDVSQLNQRLREASHRLHPSVLEDLGLVPALRGLVMSFREDGGDVSFRLPDEIPAVSMDAATAVYRIAQEGLRNAKKHAPGAPIHLTLTIQEHALELNIRDAGPGFDLVHVRLAGGLGLLSMQERARAVHGTLLLNSHPGDGTVVGVRVPI